VKFRGALDSWVLLRLAGRVMPVFRRFLYVRALCKFGVKRWGYHSEENGGDSCITGGRTVIYIK
jgi:hypothetical protein